VVVDETGDTSTSMTMDRETIASTTYGRLTGQGDGSILYNTIETLDVNLGGGVDTVKIRSTQAGMTTALRTGAGVDNITAGSADVDSTSTVNDFSGALVVNGEGGADTFRVNDSGDGVGNTDGILAATTLTGLGTAGITY
jgi:hypothetical protein